MRFASTLPLIAAALVVGASGALANLQDSTDPQSTLYASQDNAGAVDHSTTSKNSNEPWAEIRHFLSSYNFFELLNYPGARARRHVRAQASRSGAVTPAPSNAAGSASVDLETSSDPQSQPQERDFEDMDERDLDAMEERDLDDMEEREFDNMEELEERKNHKKKKQGKKNKHKKKKHGGKKSHKKKKHGKKSHKKKQNKKKHNKKKPSKKRNHKREEEGVDLVVRTHNAGDIDTRMFDELIERYNVIGDPYLNTREFIDIADLEARELGDLLWD